MSAPRTVCLLPHCGYLSETSRMVAIRRALLARGADVCVATHGGTHEPLLQRAGVPYDIVGPHMTDERTRRLVRDGPGLGSPRQSMWTDAEMRTYVAAEANYFRERGVGIAVTGFTLTTLLSTRVAGIPLATGHAGSLVPPMWEQQRFDAPVIQILPGTGWLPAAARRQLANLGTNRLGLYCAGFNRIAKELGVEGVPSFAQLLTSEVTIVTEIEEVTGIPADDLRRWRPTQSGYRASTRLYPGGPIFDDFDLPLPSRVETFLTSGGPIVYVALTSTTKEQVRSVVTALRPLGAKLLVAGTVHDVADLEREGVLVEGVLPSHSVMPRVDLAVITGGQGSVQCAMAAGTPVITLPLQPEQDLNGSLVERRGAGHRLTMRAAGTDALPRLARRMLGAPSYRDAARRIADAYAEVDGAGLAADAILSALN